nr:MAG TPA: hypothetical protein [Caudoviricetes sp.]
MSHPLWYNGIIGRIRKRVSRFLPRVSNTPSRHGKGYRVKHAPLYAVVGAGATMTRKAGETG